MSIIWTSFFDKEIKTMDEWNNPDIMRFVNAEIPPDDIPLGTRMREIIEEDKL